MTSFTGSPNATLVTTARTTWAAFTRLTTADLEGTAGPTRVALEKSGYGQSSYEVHDEYVAAATVDYINRLGIRKRSGFEVEPFSLSVGMMLPHQPFVARKEDYDEYVGKVPMPRKREPYSDKLHPYFQWWRKRTGIEEVDDDEIMRCRIAYWALVTRTDALIGEMLEALRRNGFEDNTMVVYSTDHGEQVGEHDLWWKQTFYEDSARVPAIVSWPGVLPEGGRCERVINQFDLNATMLDAVGAPPLPRSNGRSLIDLLKEPDGTPWEDVAFSEFVMYAQRDGLPFDIHSTPDGSVQRMVRYNEWKLNYYHGMRPQLFNLGRRPQRDERPGRGPGLQLHQGRACRARAGRVGPGRGDPQDVAGAERRAGHERMGRERGPARYLPLGPAARDGLRGRAIAAVACLRASEPGIQQVSHGVAAFC